MYWLRAVLLATLLVAEVLAFSLVYDLQPLQNHSLPLLRFIGYGTTIFRILAVALAVLLVTARHRLPAVFRRWRELVAQDRTFPWMLAGQLAAASCFALLAGRVLLTTDSSSVQWEVWLWLATGVAALSFWLTAAAPPKFWIELWQARQPKLLAMSLIVGLAVHFVAVAAQSLWLPLSDLTLVLSKRLLGLIASDVVYDPAKRLLGTSAFSVEISPVCSGYEGIGLVAAALALFLILFRQRLRFPNALVLLPLGIVAIWFCNLLRIVTLIWIGSNFSPEIAVGGFHSQAGWIGFAFVTLVIGYVALRLPWFAKTDGEPQRQDVGAERASSAAYLMPLLAMIAATMVAAAFSSGFDRLYPLKVIAGAMMIAWYASAYRSFAWNWSWVAAAIGVIVFALWLALEPLSGGDGTRLVAGLHELSPTWRIAWLCVRVFGSVVVVPIAEELAFRGYLMRRITCADFDSITYRQSSWVAVVVSSILFGLLHGRWFAGSLAGVCYAVAARRRNELCDAIVAHGVTNGLIAICVLCTNSWQLWS